MDQQTTERNPFMLLMHPEQVLAAIEKSERLERLHRRLCRPLDRPTPGCAQPETEFGEDTPTANGQLI